MANVARTTVRSLLARASVVVPRSAGFGFLLRPYPRNAIPDVVQAALLSRSPALEPYEVLSHGWGRYGASFVPRYGTYIRGLVKDGLIGPDAALDLACGTGFASGALAPLFGRVYALDSNSPMLEQARQHLSPHRNVTFIQADFAAFALPGPVDVAVCSGDSLNYVRSPAMLADVFRCVAAALRVGGYLPFDLQSEASFRQFSKVVLKLRSSGVEWYQVHNYDPETQTDDSCAATSKGVEQHRRLYLSPERVTGAAQTAGLGIVDRFDNPVLRWLGSITGRDFYVLRRLA